MAAIGLGQWSMSVDEFCMCWGADWILCCCCSFACALLKLRTGTPFLSPVKSNDGMRDVVPLCT